MAVLSYGPSVYVIKRPYSRAMFTINNRDEARFAKDSLPKILCFQDKAHAQYFSKLVRDMGEARPNNMPCIDQVPLESLKRRCRLNSLGLAVYTSDGAFESVREEPGIDDFTFHLENNLRWYSA